MAGKVTVVTGAANGLGAAISTLLAAEGSDIALLDMADQADKVLEAIESAGGKARFWKVDVTDEQRVQQAMSEVFGHFGRLDVLVNNAGIIGPEEPTDLVSYEAWQRAFSVNVGGPFLCTKYAIPFMRRSPGQSSIINMSSIYGIIGNADSPTYHATKGAVRLMSKTDAVTYAGEGIRVNSVHPGTIMTPLNIAKSMNRPGGSEAYLAEMKRIHPLGTLGDPEDVAYGVLYLASDESKFMTGSELVIDGGFTAQ